MKKHIIITLIILAATVYVTVVYFKNLNPPGTHTSQVMQSIPDNASLIFEFNNDDGFYDIFKDNKLFSTVIGSDKMGELDTLRRQLLQNQTLSKYFSGQNVFISVHPSTVDNADVLFTTSAGNDFTPEVFEDLTKQHSSSLLVTPLKIGNKQGYTIYVGHLKKRFYLIDKGDNTFSGSFSKELINESAAYVNKGKQNFVLLSEQQRNNSLADLYVNYDQLNPLFDKIFKNKNTDIFKNFRQMPGFAALSLNFRSDAIMFNGSTKIEGGFNSGYLSLFSDQKPVTNHLKDIFPSTTAYGTSFSVSDPSKFETDLAGFQQKAGTGNESDKLLKRIYSETGIKLRKEIAGLLGNEFAIITTRYFEKFGFVSVNDGSKLKLLIAPLSTMDDENNGQLSYEKIPFFLLGDAFAIFKKPYFTIIDNYLVFANSRTELNSFNDLYLNRKFLSQNKQYNQFDNLLAGQSNVSFFFHFKNAQPIFERDMNDAMYNTFKANEMGWKNFYAASVQLSAVDKNFYTNFCMKLNTDTVATTSK